MEADIKQIIENAYSVSKSENKNLAVSSLFDIIQIKADNREYLNEGNSIYEDIKMFVCLYIESIENKNNYGYDSINLSKIKRAIELNPEIEEKVSLYNKSIRHLKERGFDKESRKLESDIKKTHIRSLFQSCKPLNIIKAIACCLFYNLWTVSSFILLFFISYVIITLPFSNINDCLFILDYNNHCNSFILNHILNIFGDILEFNERRFCNPNNFLGTCVALLYKFIFVVYAGWFMKKISNRLKITLSDYEC